MNSLNRNFAMFTFALIAIFLVISNGTDAKRLKRYEGGKPAQSGKYSWAVAISFTNRGSDSAPVCGGAIIDADHVLTAAHCVELVLPSELIVRVGNVDLRSAIEIRVSRIINHPEYIPKTGVNNHGLHDIAILKLRNSLKLGDSMSAIRLPKKDRKEVTATFAAWGALSIKPYTISPILQVANVKVISDKQCEKRNRTGRRPHYICVYHSTGAMLQGDSGCPLTYGDEIIGIAASGPRLVGVPSSFTNVYFYLDWIKRKTLSENDVLSQ